MFGHDYAGAASAAPQRAPKLSHKKSRFGCQRCRQRRVKCDEAKPVCDNCERHRAACFYDRVPPPEPSMVPAAPLGSGTAEACLAAAMAPPAPKAELNDPAETRERRMTEVRLMHRYVTETGGSVAIDDRSRLLYCTLIPKMALASDALLYCLYSIAALHLVSAGEDAEQKLAEAHRGYLSMALREHNKAVAGLSRENADVICLTSSLFRVCSFTLLQERPRRPYGPPVEWLMTNASTAAVFRAAFRLVGDNPRSVASMLSTTPIIADEDERFDGARRRGLEHLVQRDGERDAAEPWDGEIQDAYETTLSYLGGAVHAAGMGELAEVCRRLVIFPMLVKGRFIELVQEGRSRAMVLLAYYFGLLSLYETKWWIGEAGGHEVRCIAESLDGAWLGMVQWPLDVVKNGRVGPLAAAGGSRAA